MPRTEKISLTDPEGNTSEHEIVSYSLCNKWMTPAGCSFGDKCKWDHVPPCTNPSCVSASKQGTHTFASCGLKGGGAHEATIALKMRRDRCSEKAFLKHATKIARDQTGEFLYPIFEKILQVDYLQETLAEFKNKYPDKVLANNLAGKITGMYISESSIEELADMRSKENDYTKMAVDAIAVLYDKSD